MRSSPRRAILWLGQFVTSVSPMNSRPRSQRIAPERMLTTVVFPAPFGPMSAVICPSGMSNAAPFTACTPWNAFVIPSQRRAAVCVRSSTPTPFTARLRARSGRLGGRARRRRGRTTPKLAVRRTRSGTAPCGRNQSITMSTIPTSARSKYSISPGWPGISGRNAGRWTSSVSTSSAPDEHPDVVADAADEQHGEDDERLTGEPGRRVERAAELDEKPAADPCIERADQHRLELHAEDVLAERRGDNVVVADRAERATHRRARHAAHDEPHEKRHDAGQAGEERDERVDVESQRLRERLRDVVETVGAVEQPHVVVAEVVEHERQRDQDDREVVGPQPPERDERDDEREAHRRDARPAAG